MQLFILYNISKSQYSICPVCSVQEPNFRHNYSFYNQIQDNDFEKVLSKVFSFHPMILSLNQLFSLTNLKLCLFLTFFVFHCIPYKIRMFWILIIKKFRKLLQLTIITIYINYRQLLQAILQQKNEMLKFDKIRQMHSKGSADLLLCIILESANQLIKFIVFAK
ncbi:unnamed protein product [Paramecium octaurelia]|uniref:Transmembrane protein n=1 Tax=Paramecium octaurelia TaxID=43137 RepID=A0A8S1UFN3_PAROT|nr:unnamed protein product [Paramecium octaurelia]